MEGHSASYTGNGTRRGNLCNGDVTARDSASKASGYARDLRHHAAAVAITDRAKTRGSAATRRAVEIAATVEDNRAARTGPVTAPGEVVEIGSRPGATGIR